MSQLEQVREFHQTYGMPVSDTVKVPSIERLKLRLNLIAEELDELFAATIGTPEHLVHNAISGSTLFNQIENIDSFDMVETADALGDLIYVINGMALELGIPLDDVFEEIHDSNMSKLDKDGKVIYREDGKVLKGSDFFEPHIKEILDNN